MTKAKEYADQYIANPTHECLVDVCTKFALEVEQLVKQRNAKCDDALFAILNELDMKWRSFVRQLGDKNPNLSADGFIAIAQNVYPKIAPAWLRWRNRK